MVILAEQQQMNQKGLIYFTKKFLKASIIPPDFLFANAFLFLYLVMKPGIIISS
jgi:hypothetical protein